MERAADADSEDSQRQSAVYTYAWLRGSSSQNETSAPIRTRDCVPVREHKSVTVEPFRALWVGVEEADERGRRGQEASEASNMEIAAHRVKRTWVTGAMPIGAPKTDTDQIFSKAPPHAPSVEPAD